MSGKKRVWSPLAVVGTVIVIGITLVVLAVVAYAAYRGVGYRSMRISAFNHPGSVWTSEQGDVTVFVDDDQNNGRIQINHSDYVEEYSIRSVIYNQIMVDLSTTIDNQDTIDTAMEEVWPGVTMIRKDVMLLHVKEGAVFDEEQSIILYRQE